LGSIETGKMADLIACPGNPATRLSDVRGVNFVMQGGKIVRDDSTHL